MLGQLSEAASSQETAARFPEVSRGQTSPAGGLQTIIQTQVESAGLDRPQV